MNKDLVTKTSKGLYEIQKLEEYFMNRESTNDIHSSFSQSAPKVGVFVEDDIKMYQI